MHREGFGSVTTFFFYPHFQVGELHSSKPSFPLDMPSGEASYIYLFIFPVAGTMWQCIKFMKPWMQPEHVAASQRKKTKKKSKPNYRAFWLSIYLIIHFFPLDFILWNGNKCLLVSLEHLGKRTDVHSGLLQATGWWFYFYVFYFFTCFSLQPITWLLMSEQQ